MSKQPRHWVELRDRQEGLPTPNLQSIDSTLDDPNVQQSARSRAGNPSAPNKKESGEQDTQEVLMPPKGTKEIAPPSEVPEVDRSVPIASLGQIPRSPTRAKQEEMRLKSGPKSTSPHHSIGLCSTPNIYPVFCSTLLLHRLIGFGSVY